MLNITDEIKSRLNIVDVLKEYIKLNQAGTNFKALCPFHNEKTPSFTVSQEKQIWHCFGCGEGGDIFGFVMKMENMEFADALRILAKKAGVKLTKQDPKLASLRGKLLEIISEAINFYQFNLWQAPLGQAGRNYLAKRKISEETAKEFKLGFAPDAWDNLFNYLKGKGYSEADILASGLAVKKQSGNSFYDRFRNRLIFPILDVHNQAIGFGGRTLAFGSDEEKTAKYINTPQTIIYNKSQAIYGIDKAKLEIRKKDLVILVEGYLDVISSYQAGVKNIAATSGTALTNDHLEILKRYSNNLALAFDADLGGQKASGRGIDLALAKGMNVKIILIPEGKDPDECIKMDPKKWLKATESALSYLDYYFDKTLSDLDVKKAEGKKEAAKILLPIISKLSDKVEQSHYLQKLAQILNVSEQILRERLDKPSRAKDEAIYRTKTKDRGQLLSERILALSLKYGFNFDYLINNLTPAMLADDLPQKIYSNLIIYYTNSNIKDFNYQEFQKLLDEDDPALAKYADYLILLAEKDFFDFKEDHIRKELLENIKCLKKDFLASELKKIEGKIRIAEVAKNEDEIRQLVEEFNQLTRQLSLVS